MRKAKRAIKNESVSKLPLPVIELRKFLWDENLCLTQTKLAHAIGISQPMLSQILHGKRKFLLPTKMLESAINEDDRRAKLSWIILAVDTLLKNSPRRALLLLPDNFVKQNHALIKDCLINKLTSRLFPKPSTVLTQQ